MSNETCKDCGAPMIHINQNGDVMCARLYKVAHLRWWQGNQASVSHETLTDEEKELNIT